jgi:methyl-accepting chemotaxis protein
MILISTVFGIMGFNYSIKVIHNTVDEELNELTKAYSDNINELIIERKEFIERLSYMNGIRSMDWETQKVILKNEIENNEKFKDIFIVDKNGNAKFLDGTRINIADNKYFKEAINGNVYFSDLITDIKNKTLNLFTSAPIKNGSIDGVIVGIPDGIVLRNKINNIKIKENGKAFIINSKGTVIAHPDIQVVIRQENIIEKAKTDSQFIQLAKIVENMIKGKSGVNEYVYEGNKYQCGYHPVGDTGWSIAIKVPEKELIEEILRFRKNAIIFFVIVNIIAIGIIYFVGSVLIKPIILVTKHAKIMSELDLTTKVPDKYLRAKDEIGDLARAFYTISENTKKVITEIHSASNKLTISSKKLFDIINENTITADEIAKEIEMIATGANEQAGESKSAVTELSQLGELIVELQKTGKEVNESSSKVQEVTQNGKDTVERLKEEFDLNVEIAGKVKHNTQELADQSKSIVDILNTISSIASQTNLLALNASIEAARAGESGRGFAVVAEEIKILAEETENATKNISNILGTMTNKINITDDSMNRSSVVINNVNKYLNKTINSYDVIQSSTKEVTEELEKLMYAFDIISKNKIKTFASIESILDLSQQSAASTKEVNASVEEQTISMENMAKSSEELALIATVMDDSIRKFKYK